MTIRQLEVFLAVAREGSFSVAARRIHLSQPTLSEHVAELEKELGAKLFVRTGRGIGLTEPGRIFEAYASRAVMTIADAGRAMQELGGLQRGSLVVGASTTPGTYLLPGVIARFRAMYPGIVFRLELGNSRDIEERVQGNELDLGIVGGHELGRGERCVAAGVVDELVLVARARRRHEHVPLGAERCQRRFCNEARMVAADHAHVADGPQRLPADAFRAAAKRAHREIELARLERGFQLFELHRFHSKADSGGMRLEMRQQRRQQTHETRIDDAERKGARRGLGVERPVPRAQHRRVVEQGVDRVGELERLGRRLHAMAGAHEQRIREVAAQLRERLAESRLRHAEYRRRPRQVALAQQHLESPQLPKVDFHRIPAGNHRDSELRIVYEAAPP